MWPGLFLLYLFSWPLALLKVGCAGVNSASSHDTEISGPPIVAGPFIALLESLVFDPDADLAGALGTLAACECAARALSRRTIDGAALRTLGTHLAATLRVVDPATLRFRNRWHRILIDAQRGRVLVTTLQTARWIESFERAVGHIRVGSPSAPNPLSDTGTQLRSWAAGTLAAHTPAGAHPSPEWPMDWRHRLTLEAHRLLAAASVAARHIVADTPGPEAGRAFLCLCDQFAWLCGVGIDPTGFPNFHPSFIERIRRLVELEEALERLAEWELSLVAARQASLIAKVLRLRAGRRRGAIECLTEGGWVVNVPERPTTSVPAGSAAGSPAGPPLNPRSSESAHQAKPQLGPGACAPAEARIPASGSSEKSAAVIDIGSNAVRLLAAAQDHDLHRRTIAEDRVPTGLGAGLADASGLPEAAMQETASAVARFVQRARSVGCDTIGIYATAAVREARNAQRLVTLVHERTGHELCILSGRQEGIMAFRGAGLHETVREFDGLVDIGGGSAQIVLARRGVIVSNVSLPLGAVRLTQQFEGGEDPAAAFESLRTFVDESVKAAIPKWWTSMGMPIDEVTGCGGGFTAAAALEAAVEAAERPTGAASVLKREVIRAWLKRLKGMTPEQRVAIPGLPGDRARIAVSGLCVADCILRRLGASRARLSFSGVRGGLIDRLLSVGMGGSGDQASAVASARALADRCGDERPHSEHVRTLSLSLFDQLHERGTSGLSERGRVLLACAATVHDVGLLAGVERHHKSGRSIVLNQPLAGLDDRENAVVGEIVRYHRKAGPSAEHAGFAALTAAQASTVQRLAGILRIADGLDRTHTQSVSSVHADLRGDVMRVVVTANGDNHENVAAASLKSDVLAGALGLRIDVEHAGDGTRG